MGPHPPKRFILECFFLALPPTSISHVSDFSEVLLKSRGFIFQAVSSKLRQLPAASSTQSQLDIVVLKQKDAAMCVCPGTTTTKLWSCVVGLPSPGCCGGPDWSRSCPAVYRFGTVAPRPPPSERWWPHPRLRKLKSGKKRKSDLGKVWSGSPLKMKACKSIHSKTGGCCCGHSWIQNTNMRIWAEGRRDERSWGAAFPPERERHTCGEEGFTWKHLGHFKNFTQWRFWYMASILRISFKFHHLEQLLVVILKKCPPNSIPCSCS